MPIVPSFSAACTLGSAVGGSSAYSEAMLIYGKQAVLEALRQGNALRLILAKGMQDKTARELESLAKRQDIPWEYVARTFLDQSLKTTQHQGVAAELPELSYADPEAPFALAAKRQEQPLLLLLDQISDPRNYGAIIRSAEVLGAHAVVTEERRSASLSPIVAKVSAGASSHLPLVQVKNLPRYIDQLKERGVWIYGSSGDASKQPADLDWQRPVALVIGSEGSGMRRLVRDKCDEHVAIAMRGNITALNASVAASILIYEALQRRHAPS